MLAGSSFTYTTMQASRMMRLTWATILAALISAPTIAQQTGRVPQYAQGNTQATAGQARIAAQPQANAGGRQAVPQAQNAQVQNRAAAPAAPFQPLTPTAQAQLHQLLKNWEQQSKGTKTLECKFKRWHFDMFAAPAGVHATYATGIIKYGAPDRGLFRVEDLLFFTEMQNGKPQFKPQPNQFGEYWVCNGKQVIEYNRNAKECNIQDLPQNLQGQQIFNSPLPFVFNLDAEQIQRRYWVRQVQAPEGTNVYLIEAWPKLQEDRAQYKLVQVALDKKTFLPHALIMYPPNFNAKKAANWDHYEFIDVKRNSIGAALADNFLKNFIPEKPPADWKIHRNPYSAPTALPPQQAAAAGQPPQRR